MSKLADQSKKPLKGNKDSSKEDATPEQGGQEPGADAPSGGSPDLPAQAGEGMATLSQEEHRELTLKAGERDLYRDELLRTRADFENYQKRMQKERPQLAEQGMRRIIADLLPVIDNFDRALGGQEATVEGIRNGILIVRQMLQKVLREHGVEEIEALGKPFDPQIHEAIVQEATNQYPSDAVSEVLQRGYTHKGTVLRAAQVKVARPSSLKGKDAVSPDDASEGGTSRADV